MGVSASEPIFGCLDMMHHSVQCTFSSLAAATIMHLSSDYAVVPDPKVCTKRKERDARRRSCEETKLKPCYAWEGERRGNCREQHSLSYSADWVVKPQYRKRDSRYDPRCHGVLTSGLGVLAREGLTLFATSDLPKATRRS